jgi:anti-sigma factor ChrR (cupin superfamily)
MAYFSIDDPDFFDAVTPEELRWAMEIPRKAGMEMATLPIGDGNSGAVGFIQLPPGGAIPRHAHHCSRIEVVLRGSIDTGDGTVVGPGAVMVSEPGEYYGPHTAGPEGAITLEIFGSLTAATDFDDQGDPRMAEIIAMAATELERLLAEQAGPPGGN